MTMPRWRLLTAIGAVALIVMGFAVGAGVTALFGLPYALLAGSLMCGVVVALATLWKGYRPPY
jgi:hypothetical protein